MIVENSGLLSVAALKQLDCKGKKVVCVLSGGNMDVITMSSIVQHGLIQRDRIFSVCTYKLVMLQLNYISLSFCDGGIWNRTQAGDTKRPALECLFAIQ